jgi:hypothetical protein
MDNMTGFLTRRGNLDSEIDTHKARGCRDIQGKHHEKTKVETRVIQTIGQGTSWKGQGKNVPLEVL